MLLKGGSCREFTYNELSEVLYSRRMLFIFVHIGKDVIHPKANISVQNEGLKTGDISKTVCLHVGYTKIIIDIFSYFWFYISLFR